MNFMALNYLNIIDKAIYPCLDHHTWNGKLLFISEMNFQVLADFSTWEGADPTERLVRTVPTPRCAKNSHLE